MRVQAIRYFQRVHEVQNILEVVFAFIADVLNHLRRVFL